MFSKRQVARNCTRRDLLAMLAVVNTLPLWTTPVVYSVALPAHAQTSEVTPPGGDPDIDAECVPDTQAGGPLSGSASQADNCQAACEFTANQQEALLCSVEETATENGVDCLCLLDTE